MYFLRLLGHFFVDVAIAVEGTEILDVAGNLGNQVGVLYLLVEIADQNATGQMKGSSFLPGRSE